ncbi:DNA-binding transcriptional regulator, MerR family [Nocardiopsis flavescens]|uniref:DNA-binding transcriptional regulator, MerR family n=1 Tax=Nocardiopsis flavescens TaxID=758803 RepID=A0A1M6AP06_9ACTN|nr:DNA-binding transcriptional regulator, MerR family [Nocardiopsis flavescens]
MTEGGGTAVEWTIGELAARAGVSSRTLRHYDLVGLLPPSRTGPGGLRHYGPGEVARLQRILLLRRTGMGLADIGRVLSEELDEVEGLRAHVAALEEERERVDRRLRAVRHTLRAREAGVDPSPDVMLEGFNDRYEEEVVRRWGEEAFRAANDWWHGKGLAGQQEWKRRAQALVADWAAAHREGAAPGSARARDLAVRHVEWLAVPGTPLHAGERERSVEMVECLADAYAKDPAYAHIFRDAEVAEFVREALYVHTRTRM